METAVSRIDLYTKINRDKPGFFDNIIPCGNKLLLTHIGQLHCVLSVVIYFLFAFVNSKNILSDN